MTGCFVLGNDGHPAVSALRLDVIELLAGERLIGPAIQAGHCRLVRPQPECCIPLKRFFPRVAVDIIVEIVAEVQVEGILFEEGEIRPHLDQEVGRVVVTAGIELFQNQINQSIIAIL